MSKKYFVIVNDNPPRHLIREEEVVIAGRPEAPQNSAIYTDKDEAIEDRDKLREKHDNPDLNVYEMELTPIEG